MLNEDCDWNDLRLVVVHNHPIFYQDLLFTALAKIGMAVEKVFAASKSNDRLPSSELTNKTATAHVLSAGSIEELPQWSSAYRALRILTSVNPDIVVISGYSYLPTWSSLIWANVMGRPVVFWSESNLFDRKRHIFPESIKQMFVGICDAAEVYGKSNSAYIQHLGMNSAAIMEMRAVVDCELFLQESTLSFSAQRRFVYVGRFAPEKNLAILLQALSRVTVKSQCKLYLAGYGPDEAKLRVMVDSLELPSQVVFVGACSQKEVREVFSEAHCLILPSLSEPWGLVVNEALCAGIPVIVSDRCGCAQDLVNEKTGWTFDARNADELAQRIEHVCGLPRQRLAEMGEAAKKLGSRYSPDACAARIRGHMQKVLQRFI